MRKKSRKKQKKFTETTARTPKSKPKALNAEEIAAAAIAELKAAGVFDAFVRAKHNDALDASHIDLAAVNFSQPKLFVLQVKTKVKKKEGLEGKETPTERHIRKYPNIPVIEVKLGQERRRAIRKAKLKIKEIYALAPSAEKVLDGRVLEIIAGKFKSLGHENLFFIHAP